LSRLPESSWEELHTDQEITVSRRPVKNSDLHLIRGVGVVDASPDDLFEILYRAERRRCTLSSADIVLLYKACETIFCCGPWLECITCCRV
jgi:hypothetical protein